MADNINITAGSGTAIKTDQGGATSAHMQVVKLAYSADGDETLITADGDGLEVQIGKSVDLTVQPKAATAFPVTDNGGALSIDDNGGSVTVDAAATAPVAVRLSSGAAFVDAIPVTDNGGTLSVDDAGGALTVDGTVTANQGTPAVVANSWPVQLTDGSDSALVTTGGALHINLRNNAGTELGTSADPVEVTLRTSGGTELGTSADPVEVTIRSSGGTELGTAADPVQVGLVNGAGTEIGTEAAPLHVEIAAPQNARVTSSISVSASQTAAVVWTPASGKKFVIDSIFVSVSVAGDFTLFDQTDSAANHLFKCDNLGTGILHHVDFSTRPWSSSTADNVLKYTSGTGITGFLTVHGFEV